MEERKICAFLCTWCSYAGADLAGVSRLQYPPNIKIIRVPCSGRVDPLFILNALKQCDGVFTAGCHPGDCHYSSGNLVARRKFSLLHSLIDFIGVEKERVRFDWISAAEGNAFARKVTKMTQELAKLDPWDRWGGKKND
ncbi:hydrogenase iron-sulfur subunit [Candidatus Formimonas warabiya]|nr:hydrogenase iron-sulfur subunit [Candidatus Formimonas warabiya]